VAINLGVVAWLGAAGYSPAVNDAVRVVGLAIVPGILAFLAEIILISLGRARAVAWVAVSENGLRLALSAAVLARGGGVVELMVVLLGTRSFAFVAYLFVLGIGARVRVWQVPQAGLLRRAREVTPVFFVHAVLGLLLSRLDFLALSLYRRTITIEQFGHYAVAYRLFEVGGMVVSGVVLSLFPAMSRQYTASRRAFGVRIGAMFTLGLFALLAVGLIGYGFADVYVRVCFAHQYPAPVPLARWYALALIVMGLDAMVSAALTSSDRQLLDLKALAAGGGVYALALWILIPSLGLFGALIATVLAIGVQLALRMRAFGAQFRPLVQTGRIARFLAVMALLAALVVWAARSGGPWGGAWTLAIVVLVYPPMLALAGLWEPRRLLRATWPAGLERDPATLPGLLDHIAADLRRSEAWARAGRRMGGHVRNWGFAAATLYRVSRFFHLRGRAFLARLLWQANLVLTKADIPGRSVIGPGLLLTSPVGVIIAGEAGRGVTFGPFSGIGTAGRLDVGAGRGVPLVEDGGVVGARARLLGGVRVGPGERVGTGVWVYAPSVRRGQDRRPGGGA
jgi:O-antigen/teichoic acid export membrane protein/serine acetyltransferase